MKYIIVFALGLFATSVSAQEWFQPTPFPCLDYITAHDIAKSAGEEGLFYGMGSQLWYNDQGDTGESIYAMKFFVNQTTGTWGIVQIYPDGTTCLIMSGIEFEPFSD
jgi:hypothetical protein